MMHAFAVSISVILIVCAFNGLNAAASGEVLEGGYGVPIRSLSENYLKNNITMAPFIFITENLTRPPVRTTNMSDFIGPMTLYQAPLGNQRISFYPGKADEEMRPNAISVTKEPPKSDMNKLMPWDMKAAMPVAVYHEERLKSYSDFAEDFSGDSPFIWTHNTLGWARYAVCSKDTWMKVALFAPSSGNIEFYEINPFGIITSLKLKVISSGYYYIWYKANEKGRHIISFNINGKMSNAIAIDVVPS
jgi:hypothetical protein